MEAERFPIDPDSILRADWVFGYGSLIWDPDFEHEERALARVRGWHRAFCIASTMYRGTPRQPGVVLGLARGGSVVGMAFRLRPATRDAALLKLYEREMPTRVYRPRLVRAHLEDGRRVRALAFVADTASPHHLRLPEDEVVERLLRCAGERGPNREYAINTWHALSGLGVSDARLARLVRRIEARTGTGFVDAHRRVEP